MRLFIEAVFPGIILLGGVYFSFRFRFFSLLHPIRFIRSLRGGSRSFASLNLALAGTLGVGNIIGVVNAMRLGGAGSVFWMCVSALLCANLKYAEAYMASLTKKRREGNSFGGGYVYIERIFKRYGRRLAVVFTVFFIISSLSTGACMQAGAVVRGVSEMLPGIPLIIISSLLAVAVILSTVGGMRRISEITNRTVPIMTLIYLVLSFTVIISHAKNIPTALTLIFSSAFKKEGVIFGVGGFCFTECMRCGIMRGLLSNEAGCGSSACAHATEENTSPHRQGCLGIAEVYADTVVMCTVTALALITGGADMSVGDDILLTLRLYEMVGGKLFVFLISACICVFGYATLICFAGYGDECVRYLFGEKRIRRSAYAVYLIFYIVCIVFSPFINSENVLFFADLSMGIMALINIPALVLSFLKNKEAASPVR